MHIVNLRAEVKVRYATPRCVPYTILAFSPQIIQEISFGHDVNTQTLRTLRTNLFEIQIILKLHTVSTPKVVKT